jgi:polysaccharide biosynthesis/export protein
MRGARFSALFLVMVYACPGSAAASPRLADAQEPPAAAPRTAVAPSADPTRSDPTRLAAPRDAGQPAKASAAGVPVDAKTFILGAEDLIAVRVWREPELSGSYMIRPDGKISMSLVNELQAAGLTPEQLADAIKLGLSKYINHPEVSIAVTQVNSRKYYLQGEMNRPGSYPLVVPTTVMEALVNAGGFREFANTKKIIILRKGKEQLRFNYKDVIRGKHTEQNILLEPGDQIVVR